MVCFTIRETLIDVDSKLHLENGFGTGINIAKLMMVPIEGAPVFCGLVLTTMLINNWFLGSKSHASWCVPKCTYDVFASEGFQPPLPHYQRACFLKY